MDPNQPVFDAEDNQYMSDIVRPSTLDYPTLAAVSNRVSTIVLGVFMTNIFDFFGLPGEIRLQIYQLLWEDAVVRINGSRDAAIRIFHGGFHDLSITSSLQLRQHTQRRAPSRPWLRISKKFFWEARYQLWQCLSVVFDRRWDLIDAAMNSSLDPRIPSQIRPSGPSVGHYNCALFPFRVDFFKNIRNLHLNLSFFGDFSGVVTKPEGRRAIEHPLLRLADFMPQLQGLLFTIDERSKIADADQVMLPLPWFLELLRGIIDRSRTLSAVRFIHGVGYDNGIFARKNGRYCLFAMDGIFKEHMRAVRGPPGSQERRYDVDGGFSLDGVDLRRYFGRRMDEWFVVANDNDHRDAKNLLAAKVAALA